MTTNTLPRFIASAGPNDATHVRCFGANHRDQGVRGYCPRCMAEVVRDPETRNIYRLRTRHNAADRIVFDYCCWAGTHTCDPETVARVVAEREALIAQGKIMLTARVTVVRGRKIPKGTTGIVAWEGTAYDYSGVVEYRKLGVRDDAGTMHFIRADYVALVDAEIAADEPVAPAPTSTPRAAGSHAQCSHEATPAARAKCRKARKG